MLRSSRAHYTLIVVLWGLTMLAGLGGTALWEPDEPRFAEATRQMFERGDFLTPWFNGRPRFEKPILLYWLQAPFVALMGPVETAFRLPAALAGLLTLIVVYRLGGRLASPFAGLLGALSLATMFRFLLYARQSLAGRYHLQWCAARPACFQQETPGRGSCFHRGRTHRHRRSRARA